MAERDEGMTRRDFLSRGCRVGALVGLGAAGGVVASKAFADGRVWQIDPNKCVQCGKCATACVLGESAVKCVHAFAMCGYCDFCTGFFELQPNQRNAGAENQLCPSGAIRRTYVADPYYEYTIDERLCMGCGRCVKGCYEHGNGSLFLQVRHDRCLNCNQCAIAAVCPSGAFRRVPASDPYILKGKDVQK
ncbi:MAG TPA: 4Fe-4S binding protein [Phycisphaerae bacterium]|nr:4Fe-4S binding protein [Phycisphaerae bacterium]